MGLHFNLVGTYLPKMKYLICSVIRKRAMFEHGNLKLIMLGL